MKLVEDTDGIADVFDYRYGSEPLDGVARCFVFSAHREPTCRSPNGKMDGDILLGTDDLIE